MGCHTCTSISGERRISPGPTIYETKFWLVEHAYPSKLKGWLVLVLKRHAEALHDLRAEEFAELGWLMGRTVEVLSSKTGCEKEYAMCFGEAEGFNHIHVHVVPKPMDLPEDLRGPGIFGMLKVAKDEARSRGEISEICKELRGEFARLDEQRGGLVDNG